MVRPLRIEYERRDLSDKKGIDLFIEDRQVVFVADGDNRCYLENLREWKNADGATGSYLQLLAKCRELWVGELVQEILCLMK